MNMMSASIGAVLMLMGVMCLVIKAFSVEYVGALGNLHENFSCCQSDSYLFSPGGQ